ncbi:S9 family peptidase [Marivirga sp. S37H4]|uniref:S9 family peptidase n=1 Tax=Marivirga aurantiaca TaxID=2802615 RepID=A0A935CBE6_9BACT|nr:S9 family peptidase [Marivirga aurantiaca]MBK6265333.1 S9 family peptidase [Marivirga aurantiaca]
MQKLFLAIILFCSTGLLAQQKITIEDLYGKGTFNQESVYNVNWMNDGKYYSALEDNQVKKIDVATGKSAEILVKGKNLSPELKIKSYSFSKDESKILLATEVNYIYRRSFTAKYYVYNFADESLKALSDGVQMYATFSPDASKVAYVFENNIYIVDLASGNETQVTNDGTINGIINGGSDWVYEEEFYITKTFYWSPDSKKLAFHTMDETPVKEYTLQRWNDGELYPENYVYKYPKAGEENSEVWISVYDLKTEETTKMDIGEEKDQYIPRVQWTRDSNLLSIIRMNRRQNVMEILHTNASTGESKVVLKEVSDTYVALNYNDDLTYLNDGKHFLHTSEKSGYKHLYMYQLDGKLVRQITDGNWEVESIVGIDQKAGKAYYISTEVSPLDRTFYEIGLNGKNKKALGELEGNTQINMSSDYQYYLNYYHNATTPLKVSLFKTTGNKEIKVLKDNADLKKAGEKYGLVDKEFFEFEIENGINLHGYLLKPADFDAAKKYPVIVYQYSGPGSQNVQHAWAGSQYYWHQMMVQKGYIVAVIDPRGTGARGEAFKKITYRNLGKYETLDLISGGKYLAGLDYVDADRIGIWGWSYGGYMAGNVILDGNEVFAAAVSVAMVSNWRFYDTIYTERYMDTPQNNPEGYDNNSPLSKVDKLKGKYLIVHGTGDDNVHVQHTIVFQDALLEAGKQFDLFYYPDRTHGIYEQGARPHLFHMMTDWWLKNL